MINFMREKPFVIIVNYNGGQLLRRALKSVYALRTDHVEVVIIDNASRDGSLEMCRRNFSRAHTICNTENIGFGAAANVGIRFALEHNATHILLLNPDATIGPNSLTYLLRAMHEDEKIGIASPIIFKGHSKEVWFAGGKISFARFRATHRNDEYAVGIKNPYNTQFITGCALFAKKEVFKEVGLFDERYFLYYEDADLSLRARHKGFSCAIVPQAHAWHDEVSEKENQKKIYWLVLNGLRFFQAHTPFFIKPWFYLHLLLRRLKNAFQMRMTPNATHKMIAQAFHDYAQRNKSKEN